MTYQMPIVKKRLLIYPEVLSHLYLLDFSNAVAVIENNRLFLGMDNIEYVAMC